MSKPADADATLPIVLAIGGHDPSGGAGIQADIETIGALGCHAATALTALTVQDTRNVHALHPVDPSLLHDQIRCVLEDMVVDVVKIGLLGSAPAVHAVKAALSDRPEVQLVLDPVLAAGGGAELSDNALREAIRDRLLPRTFLVTPNTIEASRLTGEAEPEVAAERLRELGCANVLISGGHEPGEEVINHWFGADGAREAWRWPRLAGTFHGSGCTLAASCAALLARGMPLKLALRLGQAFTQDALARAHAPGRGQALPRRVQVTAR